MERRDTVKERDREKETETERERYPQYTHTCKQTDTQA